MQFQPFGAAYYSFIKIGLSPENVQLPTNLSTDFVDTALFSVPLVNGTHYVAVFPVYRGRILG
jgi:hypothetical protein